MIFCCKDTTFFARNTCFSLILFSFGLAERYAQQKGRVLTAVLPQICIDYIATRHPSWLLVAHFHEQKANCSPNEFANAANNADK